MNTRVLTALLTLSLIPALSGAAHSQTLTADQVAEKHLAAMGGRDLLTKLTTRKATGTISLGTPMGDLAGTVEMIAKAPNKLSATIAVDLTALGGPGEMVIRQIFDGTTGWSLNSMQGDTPLTGDQLEGSRNAYFPTPLLNYKTTGATLTMEASQKVNGRDAHVLVLTPKTGRPSKLFFDAQTFLLVRSSNSASNPQVGEVEQISEPSDYRDVDGLKVAFSMTQSAAGQTITMKFTKVEQNIAVDDGVFIKK